MSLVRRPPTMPALAPRNHLLASLAPADLARWRPHLTPAALSPGQVLQTPGRTAGDVYFPETALLSLQHRSTTGAATDVALVGHDGMVGLTTAMLDNGGPCAAVVCSPGVAWRLGAREFHAELARGQAVLHLMLRYTQALTAQMAQTALCARHHDPAQQLGRWLLLGLDRLEGQPRGFSAALVAPLRGLSAGRAQAAMQHLQAAGAITCERDEITVLRRDLLEQQVCECHRIIQRENERLLS